MIGEVTFFEEMAVDRDGEPAVDQVVVDEVVVDEVVVDGVVVDEAVRDERVVEGTPVTLRDGTVVGLRPIRRDDVHRLARFHTSLSSESQYLRFFSCHPQLSDDELEWFTSVDHHERDAIVAVLDGSIVGVGRLDHVAGEDAAEIAFVVTDRFQGRGLGTILVRWVIERAGELGLARVVADTLPSNRRMLAAFGRVGLPMSCRFDDGVVHVTLSLGPGPALS